MVYFDYILHTYACKYSLATDMRNHIFVMDDALLSISPVCCGQLVKMLITLEPHGIFGPNCMLAFFKIVQPLVCKTVTRLLGEIKT